MLTGLCLALAGCADEAQVTSYTVPKQPPEELRNLSRDAAPANPHPMLPPGMRGPESRGDGASPIAYDVPEGWQESSRTAFSIASFQVADGGRTATITVSSVAGSVADNVNRWRGQVGLPSQSAKELVDAGERVPVGKGEGMFVELIGPERDGNQPAILGVVAQAAGRQWFFKFTGDAQLAQREKDRFREFVKSVRFEGEKGAGDGD